VFPGNWAALGLYALLAVVLTWPLAAHLTDRLPAGDNDLWQNYWNFWWWRTAIFERGQLPYHTDLIYQPLEVSLAFHTHSEANVLLTLPLQWFGGVPLALNTAVLLSFILCAWGGYFLAREVVGDPRAAFVAGIVLGFFPHRMEQSLEHVNLASFQAMPFFLAFFLRVLRQGGARSTVPAGLLFALNALFAWHNGLLVVPLALVLFGHALAVGGRPRMLILRDTALSGVVALVAMLPFAWPMVRELLSGETYFVKPPVRKAIDPLFLFLPSEAHTIWGSLLAGVYERLRGYASLGFTCYLGLVPIGLWIAGRWTSRRDWRLWSALFALSIVLALGDTLVVAGSDTGAPMPFAWLRKVPILSMVRLPNRFVVPAMVALCVLCALGVRQLRRGWASWTAAAAIAVEFLALPYPLRELPQPRWIEAARQAPEGILLNIPGGHRARGAEDLYFQTLHSRPIAGGYASCIPPAMEKRVASLPYLELVFEGRPRPELEALEVEPALRRTLEALSIRIVVVHLDRKREDLERRRAELRGTPQARLANPEQGTRARVVDETLAAMRRLWGEPAYEDREAAVFVRR